MKQEDHPSGILPSLAMPKQSQVLVVDDMDPILVTLRLAVECLGMAVVTAKGGTQALEVVKERVFDFIILDIDMPGMDGFEVCKILKKQEQTRHIPVILMTGRPDFWGREKSRGLGACCYLAKPFTLVDLRQALETAAGGRQMPPQTHLE